MLKVIHAQENRETAAEKMTAVIAAPRGWVGRPIYSKNTATRLRLPGRHWLKLRTNNPLESIMREIRRRTRAFNLV